MGFCFNLIYRLCDAKIQISEENAKKKEKILHIFSKYDKLSLFVACQTFLAYALLSCQWLDVPKVGLPK